MLIEHAPQKLKAQHEKIGAFVLKLSTFSLAVGAALYPVSAQAVETRLQPREARTFAWYEAWDSQAWYCDVSPSGLAPGIPSPGRYKVGYSYSWDAGTEPLPCQHKRAYVYRTGVRFPIDQIPYNNLIRSAKLRIYWIVSYNNDPAHRGLESTSCATALHLGPARWPTSSITNSFEPGALVTPLPQARDSTAGLARLQGSWIDVDVTEVVRNWQRRGGNVGFMLLGPIEDLANRNQTCESDYSQFELVVDHRIPWVVPKVSNVSR